MGNYYQVYNSFDKYGVIGGSSASTPVVAGAFSLLNDRLLSEGKSPMGFVNPFLYQAAKKYPECFNDLTTGNTNCDGKYCCKYGFSGTKSWDPVSGLGSPNFDKLFSFAMKIKRR